jgi:hypothetical protein
MRTRARDPIDLATGYIRRLRGHHLLAATGRAMWLLDITTPSKPRALPLHLQTLNGSIPLNWTQRGAKI